MEETKDGFVLDCSVTMAWCFDDEATPYTNGVRDSLAAMRAVVPSLWPLEVANATIVGERRKRLDQARSQRFIVLLEALPIIADDETGNRAFGDAIHLARAYQLSASIGVHLIEATAAEGPPSDRAPPTLSWGIGASGEKRGTGANHDNDM